MNSFRWDSFKNNFPRSIFSESYVEPGFVQRGDNNCQQTCGCVQVNQQCVRACLFKLHDLTRVSVLCSMLDALMSCLPVCMFSRFHPFAFFFLSCSSLTHCLVDYSCHDNQSACQSNFLFFYSVDCTLPLDFSFHTQ